MSQSAKASLNSHPATPEGLAGILAPVDEASFLSQTYGKSIQHVQSEPDKFAALLPWEDLNAILEQHRLQPPRLRLTREGKSVPPDSWLAFQVDRRKGAQPIPRLDAPALEQQLRDGATLVLDAVDELQRPVRRLAESLERTFRVRVQVNAYAGWRTSHGFDIHWDDHDVFVLQVAGRKHWKVFGQTRRFPLKRDFELAPEPPPEAIWEGMLEAGSLLYIPRGWWHVATPLDEPTLHLTVGVSNPAGIDLLGWFTDQLKKEEAVRQDLPTFGSPADRIAYANRLRDAILRNWHAGLVDEYLEHLDAGAKPRPHVNLPWSAKPDVLPEGGWQVHWAINRDCAIERGADELTICARGRRWKFAPAAEPLLELLTCGEPLSPEDLERAAGEAVTREAVLTLVRDLAVHGLVVVLPR